MRRCHSSPISSTENLARTASAAKTVRTLSSIGTGRWLNGTGSTGSSSRAACSIPIELQIVAALRKAYGDQIRFMRFDPNQAWTVETSVRYVNKMAAYDLEYVEDPTWNIEGMALVRERTAVPLATNQCLISFEQFPAVVQRRAVDVLLVDPYFWGGISQAKKVATVCETFNIGLAIHSDRELGIGTAASLHFRRVHSPAFPLLRHALP
ncbi:MAG: mandelate racemase/muconate lactonizing enzyme family protein [bacterium]